MMAQETKPITEVNRKTKRKSPAAADPKAEFMFRTIPITKEIAQRWAQGLRDFVASNPEKLSIAAFIRSKGINTGTFYSIAKKFPVLQQAIEDANEDIGEKMYEQSVYFKANWSAVKHRLHQYSEKFAQADQHHAALGEKNNQPTNITVITRPIESLENESKNQPTNSLRTFGDGSKESANNEFE
jgi:hypothetical protein